MCRPARAVVCTFTNTQRAKIEIEKQTEPAAGSGFGFTGSANLPDADESFSLDDDGAKTISNLVPGTYQVNEDAKAGWDLDPARTAPIPPAARTSSLANRRAAIDLDPGETVHCTFTNRQRARSRSSSRRCPTARAGASTSARRDHAGLDAASLADGESHAGFFFVDPGTYRVSEDAKAGWDLTDAELL